MDNHEDMDKFLERYNFPRLNQEELENINTPLTSNEIETVIKNLPTWGGWEGGKCKREEIWEHMYMYN